MAGRTPMLPDGSRPDPAALAVGNFAADREGKVLEVILTGACEGTNEAILEHLQANPPPDYRGLIREPTVRCFTKSALEAGIIEARIIGGKTVHIPLENGPPFARATPEGLAFRKRVLEAANRDSAKAPSVSKRSSVTELRDHVRQHMRTLEAMGIGTASFGPSRDRFQLASGLPSATALTTRPESRSFIRSEDGSLLFRSPSEELLSKASLIAAESRSEASVKGLELRWSALTNETVDQLFAIVHELANSTRRGAASSPGAHQGAALRISRLEEDEVSENHRDWTINDATQQHHHGAVRLSESPLDMRLSWRADADSPIVFLGCFRLDLAQLLEDGYLRREREDGSEARLRFFRAGDGVVYLQVRNDSPALPVVGIEPAVLRINTRQTLTSSN